MEQARMQEIVDLIISNESHADVIDLLSRLKIPMDDFHDYTFKIRPGAQAHFEVDVLSSIQPHVHRFYEVIFVVQGNNINYIIDTQRYQLQQGDMFFIPPGHIHHPLLASENKQPYKRYVLWLEADFFHRVCSVFPSVGYLFSKCEKKKDYLLRSRESEYLNLLEAFKSLCKEEKRQHYGWEAQTAINAYAIMNQLSRAYHDHSLTIVNPMPQTKFDTAITYINQNLDQQLTLESVAQHIYVSKSTLSHLFRDNLGISVYQYIQKKRLLKAKLLILEGESMSSICEKCGFADYPTFYRAFKKMYLISPNEYRKNYTKL